MTRIPLVSLLVSFAAAQALLHPLRADTVVQFPVASILNTRSVTTLTSGALVTWLIGIDGDGNADGYLTSAASLFKGDKGLKALPDSGVIPADARHPEVKLNYSNADGTGNQTRYVRLAGEFTVPVPAAKYSKVFLFFTSSEGASTLTFLLTYADATTETKNVVLPDYFDVINTTDPVLFNLVLDMAKWNKLNVHTESNHHNLDGVELHPAADKILSSIKVTKTAKAYLVFWGATGIATSPVSALNGGTSETKPRQAMGAARIRLSSGRFGFSLPGSTGAAWSAEGAQVPLRPR